MLAHLVNNSMIKSPTLDVCRIIYSTNPILHFWTGCADSFFSQHILFCGFYCFSLYICPKWRSINNSSGTIQSSSPLTGVHGTLTTAMSTRALRDFLSLVIGEFCNEALLSGCLCLSFQCHSPLPPPPYSLMCMWARSLACWWGSETKNRVVTTTLSNMAVGFYHRYYCCVWGACASDTELPCISSRAEHWPSVLGMNALVIGQGSKLPKETGILHCIWYIYV
jgi:hypothetical protein